VNVDKLPKQSEHGDYFWSHPGDGDYPAIMPMHGEGKRDLWMISLGKGGVVFEGGKIKTFATAGEAWKELRHIWKE
jgi:hypothetical protein